MDKIDLRLQEDMERLTNMGYDVLGIFLCGSQNYELAYENSDIDTKAIIIPSFEDVALNHKPVSKTLILPSNEHIDVKDIREMFACYKKQNINFIETLFTDYCLVSPKYRTFWSEMWGEREKIAHYDNFASVKCMVGMILQKNKALTHPYEGLKDVIDKYGYDPKQIHHIERVYEFLIRYINGKSYEDCLLPRLQNRKHLIEVKAKPLYTVEEACAIASDIVSKTVDLEHKYTQNNEHIVNKEVEALFNSVILNVLKTKFKEEV